MKKPFDEVREYFQVTDINQIEVLVKYMVEPDKYQEELRVLKEERDKELVGFGWIPEEFEQAMLEYMDALQKQPKS